MRPLSSNQTSLTLLNRGLIVTTVLTALIVLASAITGVESGRDNQWVAHSLAVRSTLENFMGLMREAETGQRGYLLTGRSLYLEPYRAAIEQLPQTLDRLAALVSDSPHQSQAVTRLRALADEKINELRSTLQEEAAGRHDAALSTVNSDRGFQTMEGIRQLVGSMENEENRLLVNRQARSTLSATLLLVCGIVALLAVGILVFLIAKYTTRSIAAIAASRDQLAVSNERLIEQISRRQEVEDQLRQSQKMEALGQLTGGIAHDFNNMLGVIVGSLDLIRRRLKGGNLNVERFIDAASNASERAAVLTHRLLAFARQQPLAPQPLNGNRVIANMSDLFRSTLGEHVRIETIAAAGLWTLYTDAQQLENAILNIAVNARDAMPDGGKLTIETGNTYLDDAYCRLHPEITPGQFVMIAITDTGTGMPPEVVVRAFDPFFTTKAKEKGTGLGLSQVYGFIKQSKGHIKIYSEIDAGTTVKMYLPRYLGDAQDIKIRPRTEPLRTGNRNEIILVVEDEPSMRRLVCESLHELNYTVLECSNAADALATLDRETGVKLLFTDVVMPDTNGKKLADEACDRRPDLKVLFTTGYTSNAVVHGGVLDPGVNFIGKPFTLDQLAAKVRFVLDDAIKRY
jgi:signal transduction histidine kinase/CheY-like chemotaxis protein